MSEDEGRKAGLPLAPLGERKRKRPDVIADHIRDLIVARGLKPGDRLPQEWLLQDALKASRGTLREAMKILEFQGLITNKTGPGGGAFISVVTPQQAMHLLSNLFLFKPPSIADIYAIRKLLEPELAASLAGALSDEAFAALQATIRLYEDEPRTAEEEYEQRLAELDFHAELASQCENAVLGLLCAIVLSLLRETSEFRAIYGEPNPSLRETGLHYQVRLLRAIRAGDSERARAIMFEHMTEAESYMRARAETRRRAQGDES